MPNQPPQLLQMPQGYSPTGINQSGVSMNKSPVSNPGVVYQPANTPTNPGGLKVATQTTRNLTFKAQDGGIVNIGTQSDSPAVIVLDGIPIGGAAGIIIGDKDYKTPAPLFTAWNSAAAYVAGDLVSYGTPVGFNYVALQSSTNKEPDTQPTYWQEVDPLGLPAIAILDAYASPTILTVQNRPDAASPQPLAIIQNNSSEAADALVVSSLNLVSSHFTDIMTLAGANNTGNGQNQVTFWMSDGTTPNGHLNGNTGDICYNGPSGQPFYCTSGTSWTGF